MLARSTQQSKTGFVKRGKKMRARIRHAAFTKMPIHLSGGRLAERGSVNQFCLNEHAITIPSLPAGLEGLRIAHVSDLHIGDLVTPRMLPRIVEAIDSLDADLIAVTGDLIDLSMDPLDDVIDALQSLDAPLGMFLVPGNHDYLDDGIAFVERVLDSGLNLMINRSERIEHNGHSMRISGIDYASKAPDLTRLVDVTLENHADAADLSLLLAHHHHAFDVARTRNVNLTLSGHTHGGQVVLRQARGVRKSISVGGLACRYEAGLYGQGDSQLYVTSGVGSWFPWRVKCPAEIACLTLTSGAE